MDLDTFRKQKQELQEQISKHGKKALVTEFNQFFESNSNVEAVRWSQYTPYFNDGDSCEFGRNDFYVKLKKALPIVKYDKTDGLTSDDDDDGFTDSYTIESDRNKDPRTLALAKSLEKLSRAFSGTDDIFLDTFGDHVQVTCTRDGFDVEEQSHD